MLQHQKNNLKISRTAQKSNLFIGKTDLIMFNKNLLCLNITKVDI